MPSPFPPTQSKPGHGEIHLTLLPPATPSYSTLTYTYPLKLLPSTPHILAPHPNPEPSTDASSDPASSRAPAANPSSTTTTTTSSSSSSFSTQPIRPTQVPLLFFLTYGGGLVAGDVTTLTITLDPGTRLTLTTQGSTKIYRPRAPAAAATAAAAAAPPHASHSTPQSPQPTTRQCLTVRLHPNSALWLGPDPIQPFAGSRYAQVQIFELARGASMGMVDWVSEGRTSRGEKWGCESWRGRNEVWSVIYAAANGAAGGGGSSGCSNSGKEDEKKTLLVRDAVVLDARDKDDLRNRMDGKGVFGTVLLRGRLFAKLSRFFIEEFECMPRLGGREWSSPSQQTLKEKNDHVSELERWRKARLVREAADGVIWTAAVVRGVCVVKFSAREVEGARVWLGDMLRWEGTVGSEFGEGGLMFVR